MKLVTSKQTGYVKAVIKDADGKRRTVSTGTKNMAEAKKIAAHSRLSELESFVRRGALTQEAIDLLTAGQRTVTISQAIDEWALWKASVGQSKQTCYNHALFAKQWATEMSLQACTPDKIDHTHISDWINRSNPPAKLPTRRTWLAVLRGLFAYCAAKGWCRGNPGKLVRINMGKLSVSQKEPRLRKLFSDQEVSLLTVAAKEKYGNGSFWALAVALGRFTGLRLGDIASLEWDSFAKPGKIVVWTDKRDRRVELPLKPAALAKTVAAIHMLDAKYCFPESRKIAQDVSRRSTLSVQFQRLCGSVGIEGKSFHDLRSTYITDMKEKGVPIEHISLAVGHTDSSTTLGYVVKK